MSLLKFSRQEEIKRNDKFDKANILKGPFKFSTQTTFLYDSFALVLTETEIMKIKVECDKIFYRKGKVGILKDNKLDVFENNIYTSTVFIPKHSAIFDFPFENQIEVDNLSENDSFFLVKEQAMVISPKKIVFNGKSFVNDIHVDDSRYFVAYYDDIAIVGNDKSLNFIYFRNGELTDVDDLYPLSLRFDEETFDSIYLTDMKFLGSDLFLVDADVVTHFTVENLSIQNLDTSIAEYEIKENQIVPLLSDEFLQSKESIEIKNDYLNKADGFKIKNDEDLANSGNDSSIQDEDITMKESNEEIKPSEKAIDSTFNCEETQKLPEFITSSKETSKPNPMSNMNSNFSKSLNSLTSSSSIFSSRPIDNESKSSLPKQFSDTQASQFFKPVETVKKDVPQVPKKPDVDPEIMKYDSETTLRINKLIKSFKNFKFVETEFTNIEVIPSTFDLDGLYNLIFNNSFDDYEEALSSMIVKAEQLKALDSNNIRESIKFFNSKIFEKRAFKKPARYSDPLCSRFNKILSISNPVNDILDSIKFLNIKDQNQNIKISDEKTSFKPKVENNIPQTTLTENIEKPSTNNNQLEANTTFGISTKNTSADNFNPQPQSSQTSFGFSSKPAESSLNSFNPDLNSKPSLFGSNPGISNNFVVQNTSSLFNNLTSNITPNNLNSSSGILPSTINPQSQFPPSNSAPSTGSAFNRLAGSRKLFQ